MNRVTVLIKRHPEVVTVGQFAVNRYIYIVSSVFDRPNPGCPRNYVGWIIARMQFYGVFIVASSFAAAVRYRF